MEIGALTSRKRHPVSSAIAAAVLYSAGIIAIVGWTLAQGVNIGQRSVPGMRLTQAEPTVATDAQPPSAPRTGNARTRASCVECGVIESVRRIDWREEIIEGCVVGDVEGTRIPSNLKEGNQRKYVATLADTVTSVIAGENGARKVRSTTRHQIVVRFRDGSRRVFNEATPRTLQVGDRIQVIAGAAPSNG